VFTVLHSTVVTSYETNIMMNRAAMLCPHFPYYMTLIFCPNFVIYQFLYACSLCPLSLLEEEEEEEEEEGSGCGLYQTFE
jgi:hypothetical protein